jgi:hypothetical protein
MEVSDSEGLTAFTGVVMQQAATATLSADSAVIF